MVEAEVGWASPKFEVGGGAKRGAQGDREGGEGISGVPPSWVKGELIRIVTSIKENTRKEVLITGWSRWFIDFARN